MEWQGREESENVEDQRAMGTPTKFAIGGAGGVIVLIVCFFLGINPQAILNLLGGGAPPGGGAPAQDAPLDPQQEKDASFTKIVLKETETVWTKLFKEKGKTYREPKLVLFTGEIKSACGDADSAVGPFYCPGDEKVYIDLSFYKLMATELHAPGDFPRAYVIAHEIGHHVQNLLGYSKQADRSRDGGDKRLANQISVRLELQADYFAGVWAHYSESTLKLNKADIDQAIKAAFEIGDDKLQSKSGTVRPDSFTHGTSKQRMKWFKKGFDTGDVDGAKELFSLDYKDL